MHGLGCCRNTRKSSQPTDVDLECHETMEPVMRIRVKTPNPTGKDSGISPNTSTSTASWLLTRLDGHQNMHQSHEPATHHDGLGACSRKLNSIFSMNSCSSPVATTFESPQDSLKLTKSTLSGQREVLHLPSRNRPPFSISLNCYLPHQVSTTEYPIDWGLKSSAKFYSRKSFDWTCVDDIAHARALHGHLRGRSFVQSDEADPAEQFQNALHYWRHPAGPLPPAMASLLKKQVIAA
jgi:hypothetical protein